MTLTSLEEDNELITPQGWEKWKKGIATPQERLNFEALPHILSRKGHPYQHPLKIDVVIKDNRIKLGYYGYELPKALGEELIKLARKNPEAKLTFMKLYESFKKRYTDSKKMHFDIWEMSSFYALAYLLEHGIAYMCRDEQKDITEEQVAWAVDDNTDTITLADVVKITIDRLRVFGRGNEILYES